MRHNFDQSFDLIRYLTKLFLKNVAPILDLFSKNLQFVPIWTHFEANKSKTGWQKRSTHHKMFDPKVLENPRFQAQNSWKFLPQSLFVLSSANKFSLANFGNLSLILQYSWLDQSSPFQLDFLVSTQAFR